MLILITIWLLIIIAFVVVGVSIERVYRYFSSAGTDFSPLDPDLYFFAGFAATSMIVGALSVVVAINEWVTLTFWGVVLVLAVIQYRTLLNRLRLWVHQITEKKLYIVTLVGAAIVLIFAAVLFSDQGLFNYDTGLYHTQSVKWISNFSAVPGLGNLHGRLAFNSMFFPVSALFEIRWNEYLLYPLNSVVFVVLFVRLMLDTARCSMQKNRKAAVFYSFAAAGTILFHLHHVPSLSTDMVSSFLTIYILTKAIQSPEHYSSKGLASWIIIALILICATYKLSAALLILLIWPVFKSYRKVQWTWLVLLGLAAFLPYVVRNFVLSGYLVYPLAAIDLFSPDWKIPAGLVRTEQQVVKAWAIMPTVPHLEVLSMSVGEWLPEWWGRKNIVYKLLLVSNVISAVVGPILLLLKKEFRALGLIHLVVIINCVFWFITAPDIRFAYGFLIMNAAILFFYIFSIRIFDRIPRLIIQPVLLLFPLFLWIHPSAEPLREAMRETPRWITPSAYDDKVGLELHESPFPYYKPEKGDQCFDAPLPCTPYEPKNVEMRGEDLEDGFRPVINDAQ